MSSYSYIPSALILAIYISISPDKKAAALATGDKIAAAADKNVDAQNGEKKTK